MAGGVMMIMPAVQLDAVLTPKELADPVLRKATQARLWQQRGDSWFYWCLAGGAVAVPSYVGVLLIDKQDRTRPFADR